MMPMGRAPPEDESPPPPGPALKKGPWSATEDRILMEYVRDHGEGNWNAVQRNTPLHRCGKSCRLRWANHLRPNLKKGAFSPDEERLIIDLHSRLGNKWARISAHLPGRTDNEVKNYWNTRVKRRLRQGLPLYPLTNSHHNHQSPPPPPQPLTPPPLPVLKPPPFLDPTSLPFPAPFFSFHHLPNYNTTPGFPARSSLPGFGSGPFGFDSLKSEPVGLGFDYKLELPSNQFCPNLAPNEDDDDQDEVNVDDGNVFDYEAIDEVKFNPNTTGERGNSGLLDALLHEAQTRAEATRRRSTFKKEGSDADRHWDSIYANSSSDKGAPKTEEQDDHTYYTNEDLSSILNLIPSLVTAPKWDGRHQDASAGQSSNISDENTGIEMPQFPQVSSDVEWLNSSAGSYTSWDNLPRIC